MIKMNKETLIKQEADKIRCKIQGGALFGDPIDMNNPDHVLVAAYYWGVNSFNDSPTSSVEKPEAHNNETIIWLILLYFGSSLLMLLCGIMSWVWLIG